MLAERDIPSHHTHKGTKALAERVRAYWRARGFDGIEVELFPIWSNMDALAIRSNLVNGLPPAPRIAAIG
jgi:hypothetical protein